MALKALGNFDFVFAKQGCPFLAYNGGGTDFITKIAHSVSHHILAFPADAPGVGVLIP